MAAKPVLVVCALFSALMVATLAVLWPLQTGPFIFDDFPNLSPLGYFNGVEDFATALYFVFGNDAGPLGRPLSMASFLINDHAWPSDPAGFKFTNLMLHLMNTVLVFIISRQFGRHVQLKVGCSEWFALLASAIWALHPVHVSAVGLVVQRMTLLAATFQLGLIACYLSYRTTDMLLGATCRHAIVAMPLLVLGLLAKETVVSLFFYLFVLEFLLPVPARKSPKWFRWLVAGAVFVVLVAIVYSTIKALPTIERREFTIAERVMTESRVLWVYVWNFLVPKASSFSLFNDDMVISTSLLSPPATLWAVLAWLAVMVGLWWRRRRLPLLCFAVAWFLAGHLLESTIIPLEIYFDHRNYLPALGFAWLISGVLITLPLGRVVIGLVAVLYLTLLAFITREVAVIWGDEALVYEMWAMDHPRSARAQQALTRSALERGDSARARQLIESVVRLNSDNPHLRLQQMLLDCMEQSPIDTVAITEMLKSAPYSNGTGEALVKVQDLVVQGACHGVESVDVERFYQAVLENPVYWRNSQFVSFAYNQLALMGMAEGNLNKAIENLDLAYQYNPSNVQFPLTQTYLLADAGLMEDAWRYLLVAHATRPPKTMQVFQYRKLVNKAFIDVRDKLPEGSVLP